MKVVLATTYYKDKVKERNDELLTCIRANISCKEIDKIIIILDGGTEKPFQHPKVQYIHQENRPTFSDFVNVANETDFGLKIIANTDIYFDDYNVSLIKTAIKDNECYALSRWDEQIKGGYIHYAHRDSQDTWIFKGKIRNFNSDFLTGKPGIDNRIAHEIHEAGYEVINPSRTIKSYHLHITGIRNYTRNEGEVIPKPYKLIPCTYLGEPLKASFEVINNGEVVKRPIEVEEVEETEFDFTKQRNLADALLKEGNIPKRYLLSIVIPTMYSRTEQFKKLYKKLTDQISKYKLHGKVQILEEVDNGYAPIGWKRNKLVIECLGHYVAHFDDDDHPSIDYLPLLVKAIEDNYGVDVVTFDAIVTYDGTNDEVMNFNRKFKSNHQHIKKDENNVIIKRWRDRMPCHLNAIRRECALAHSFHVINKAGARTRKERGDSGSDCDYSLDMVAAGTLKTDFHIDKILYHYDYKTGK